MKKRVISILLCLALACALLPAALADTPAQGSDRYEVTDMSIEITAPAVGAHPDYSPVPGCVFATNRAGEASVNVRLNGESAVVTGNSESFSISYEFSPLPEPKAKIPSVALTVTEPEVGKKPSYSVSLGGTEYAVDLSNNSDGFQNGVGWFRDDDAMSPEETFLPGGHYGVMVALTAKEGYTFSEPGSTYSLTVTINGNPADAAPFEDSCFALYYFYTLPDALPSPEPAEQVITSLNIQIDPPQAGGKPAADAKLSPDGFRLKSTSRLEAQSSQEVVIPGIRWMQSDGKGQMNEFGGSAFLADMSYTALISLICEDGYVFGPDPLTVKVNGEKAEVQRNEEDNTSLTVRFNFGVLEKTNPFSDIRKEDYYYEPVMWAYFHEPQITNGVDDSHYNPEGTVTRSQVVTFLWRAKGCPEPKNPVNPFGDVDRDEWYGKAVLWAVEEGITKGVAENRFGPEITCTRAEVITFLYRAAGEPGRTGKGTWYDDAVRWAGDETLLSGTAQAFAPGAVCPRKDIVLYLYRQLA